MRIKNFLELNENELLELEELDNKVVLKYGISFSNEVWNISNFKYTLPKKNDYSFVLFESDIIIGYAVASEKNDAVYMHRFAVFKRGKAKIFFEEVLKNYQDKSIYLMVNIINIQAIRFYRQFDFDIVNDKEVIQKFIADELYIENTQIVIGEDYKCYLMKRD